MSRKFTTRCGCATPHAVTTEQVAYAKRALQVAYSTRDGAAIAKIKDALRGCPHPHQLVEARDAFKRISALALIKAMDGSTMTFAKVTEGN